MSLEKLEINKFSHNASLTGDGSNNSPLGINLSGITGLKPYNERLLFSAELSGVSSVELPTSKNHFERLRFVLGARNWKENGLESKEFGTETTAIHLNFKNGAGGNAYWVGTYGTWSDDRHLTIQKSKSVYGSYSNATITGNITYTADDINCIKEIYGVNEYPRYFFIGLPSIGGNIESNLNEGYSGDIATITVTPASDEWKQSALNITGATLTGNDFMYETSNVSAQAEFEHSRDLTLVNSEHGTLSADKMSGFSGDLVTVDATTDEGWYFTGLNVTGATATGNQFMFVGENVTAEGLYTDEGYPITYLSDDHVQCTGDVSIYIPGGTGITLQTGYDQYYRISGYDVTGGTVENGVLIPTGPCTVKAVQKVNYFTATGNFEKGSNVAASTTNYNASTVNVPAKYAVHVGHTGDIPASWYSTSNRWKPNGVSSYSITLHPIMQFTGTASYTAKNGRAATALSLIGSTTTQSQSFSTNGTTLGKSTYNYNKTFNSTTQNVNYGISAKLYAGHGYAGYPCSVTYVAAQTTGTWTATGIAP